MKKYFRMLCLLAVAIMPSRVKIMLYRRLFDADIDSTAHIGFSYIDVKKIKLGAYASIGHLNIIRGLELLELGQHAVILKQNTISAQGLEKTKQFADEKDRLPALILGDHSAIVSKHFLDCNNSIQIGHHTTIAGLGSAFFTHAINIETNKQESAPIHIGDYCMIGALSCVLKGTKLPDCCVLAANSTLRGNLKKSHALYSGVPAVYIKDIDPKAAYFHRDVGYVD